MLYVAIFIAIAIAIRFAYQSYRTKSSDDPKISSFGVFVLQAHARYKSGIPDADGRPYIYDSRMSVNVFRHGVLFDIVPRAGGEKISTGLHFGDVASLDYEPEANDVLLSVNTTDEQSVQFWVDYGFAGTLKAAIEKGMGVETGPSI